MDKIRDFPRWLPNCREYWHFSRLPGSLTQGTDRLRLMQGFVPERSFTKDRRVIDMRIDSVLMVCGTSATGRSRISDGFGNLLVMVLVMAQAGFLSTPTQSTASP